MSENLRNLKEEVILRSVPENTDLFYGVLQKIVPYYTEHLAYDFQDYSENSGLFSGVFQKFVGQQFQKTFSTNFEPFRAFSCKYQAVSQNLDGILKLEFSAFKTKTLG